MLFDSICNSKWFTRTSMVSHPRIRVRPQEPLTDSSAASQILFLNKVDIFRTKILRSSVKQYFPDYDGDDRDFNATRIYFKNRFTRLNRSATREIYPSFTNATDPSLLKIVMASVTDIILSNSLRDIVL